MRKFKRCVIRIFVALAMVLTRTMFWEVEVGAITKEQNDRIGELLEQGHPGEEAYNIMAREYGLPTPTTGAQR